MTNTAALFFSEIHALELFSPLPVLTHYHLYMTTYHYRASISSWTRQLHVILRLFVTRQLFLTQQLYLTSQLYMAIHPWMTAQLYLALLLYLGPPALADPSS
jgi:hypothetical protein